MQTNTLLLDTSANEQLLQKVKNKKLNDSIDWSFSCISGTYLLHSDFHKRIRISNICRSIF